MKIVSLLPSTTEILFGVGAGADVVGVTFECDFPEEARGRRIVSSTTLPSGLTPAEIDAAVRRCVEAGEDLYRLDAGALRELDPDLVVTQDLCAVCAIAVTDVDAALAHLGCRAEVVTVDPGTLEEVLDSIVTVGAAAGRRDEALGVVARLRRRLDVVAGAVSGAPRPRVAVVEWPDPPFGAGHWVPDMVRAAGGESVLGQPGGRSVQVSWSDVDAANPDLVVLAPCGFGLDEAARMADGLCEAGALSVRAEVWAVDADAAFVRPGPRLVDGIEALASICHPGCTDPGPALARCVRRGDRTG
jgi:iron complex transport system substrate-binding protein